MSLYHKGQSDRKSFSTVAKNYVPVKRADKPHIITSLLTLASGNMSSVMTGTNAQHECAEIFHPYLYPDYGVYQYINKDSVGIRLVEYAFAKSDFTIAEWATINNTIRNRRAYINGLIDTPSVIQLLHGSLP
jgi:hypothetical protein